MAEPSEMSSPQLLTVKEVSTRLRVSPSLVYQLVEAGKLACHRIGKGRGAIRIASSDLKAYLQACRSEYQSPKPKPTRPRLKHLKL
jgi:excisionase family DNA binding protein